jgi:hypothetical protein
VSIQPTTATAVSFTALADALTVPDGGFSVNVRTGEAVSEGFAVSLWPGREKRTHDVTPESLAEYVAMNEDLLTGSSVQVRDMVLTTERTVFGGWREPVTDAIYLDVSVVVSKLDTALHLAKRFGQLAVFDFAAGVSVAA